MQGDLKPNDRELQLDQLYGHGNAHSSTDAEGSNASALAVRFQRIDECGDDPGATRPDRVTKADCSAVNVHFIVGNL